MASLILTTSGGKGIYFCFFDVLLLLSVSFVFSKENSKI